MDITLFNNPFLLFCTLVVAGYLIVAPARWVSRGGKGSPPHRCWAGIGWILLTAWSIYVVSVSHSFCLLYQAVAAFAGTMAFTTFQPERRWPIDRRSHRHSGTRTLIRLFHYTPVGVLSLLLLLLVTDYLLSEATFRAALEQDDTTLTCLRLVGGRLQENPLELDTETLYGTFDDAIRYDQSQQTHRLLEAGTDPDLIAPTTLFSPDQTLLMEAVRYNRADVVADLLAHGADPNRQNCHGITVLQQLQSDPNIDHRIIPLLIAHGAK